MAKKAIRPDWELISWRIGDQRSLGHLREPFAPTALCGETIFAGDYQLVGFFGLLPGPDPAAHVSAYARRPDHCLGCLDMLSRGQARVLPWA